MAFIELTGYNSTRNGKNHGCFRTSRLGFSSKFPVFLSASKTIVLIFRGYISCVQVQLSGLMIPRVLAL